MPHTEHPDCPASQKQKKSQLVSDEMSNLITHNHYGNTGCGVLKRGTQNQKGFWLKINCSQMKLLDFENWSSGELSKIEHHFRKQNDLKIDVIKKCAPKFLFFNEKNQKNSNDFYVEN